MKTRHLANFSASLLVYLPIRRKMCGEVINAKYTKYAKARMQYQFGRRHSDRPTISDQDSFASFAALREFHLR